MKNKSLYLFLTVLMVVSVLLAACGKTATATEAPAATEAAAVAVDPVTIHVMTFLAYDTPEVEPQIAAAFEAANPGIKVVLESVPLSDYMTKLKTMIAGGNAPDVVSLNVENLASFASMGALTDLGPYIERDSYDMSQYYENTVRMHQFEGTQYALPASFSTVVLFYNKNLFDAAGIAYPDGTWDWNKLIEVGKALTIDNNNDGIFEQFGFSPPWWPLFLNLYDGSLVNADGTQCALTEPNAIAGFQAMVDLSLVDKIAPTRGDLATQGDWDMFQAGRLAMFPTGPWAIAPFNNITTFVWDIADMPTGKQQATFLFGNSLGISAGSQYKDAAWEYLKFAAGQQGESIRQQAGYEIAPVKTVAETEFLASLEGKLPANGEIFMNATNYAFLAPQHPKWSELQDAIWPELELALLGDKTVEEAMASACEQVNAILAEQ
jgi:multiple sugar transport system substrate-binding protein